MDTQKMLDEAMPEIKAAIVAQLTKSVMDGITYETTEALKKTVIKELVEELSPKVRAIVEEHRDTLIAGVCKELNVLASQVGQLMAADLSRRVTAAFSQSWTSNDIVRKLLGL